MVRAMQTLTQIQCKMKRYGVLVNGNKHRDQAAVTSSPVVVGDCETFKRLGGKLGSPYSKKHTIYIK